MLSLWCSRAWHRLPNRSWFNCVNVLCLITISDEVLRLKSQGHLVKLMHQSQYLIDDTTKKTTRYPVSTMSYWALVLPILSILPIPVESVFMSYLLTQLCLVWWLSAVTFGPRNAVAGYVSWGDCILLWLKSFLKLQVHRVWTVCNTLCGLLVEGPHDNTVFCCWIQCKVQRCQSFVFNSFLPNVVEFEWNRTDYSVLWSVVAVRQ